MITLELQIAAIKREIALRKNVYPAQVAKGKMKQGQADHEIEAMTAALHTVMAVKRLRETLLGHVLILHQTRCSCGWTGYENGDLNEAWINHVFEESKKSSAPEDAAVSRARDAGEQKPR